MQATGDLFKMLMTEILGQTIDHLIPIVALSVSIAIYTIYRNR